MCGNSHQLRKITLEFAFSQGLVNGPSHLPPSNYTRAPPSRVSSRKTGLARGCARNAPPDGSHGKTGSAHAAEAPRGPRAGPLLKNEERPDRIHISSRVSRGLGAAPSVELLGTVSDLHSNTHHHLLLLPEPLPRTADGPARPSPAARRPGSASIHSEPLLRGRRWEGRRHRGQRRETPHKR